MALDTLSPDRDAHKHRCMRCDQEFECYTPDVCQANYDVLPRIVVRDAREPGGVRIFDHCPMPGTSHAD